MRVGNEKFGKVRMRKREWKNGTTRLLINFTKKNGTTRLLVVFASADLDLG